MPSKPVEWGFFLLYNHLAFLYNTVAWLVSLGQWPKWRQTALRHVQPGPTLELACGTGGLLAAMAAGGLKPVGVDLSPFMARLTRRRLARRKMPVSIAQGRAQALPFPTDHFSNVIATFPTAYIFEAPTLAEVRRVLNSALPQARLIVVFQGYLNAPAPIRALIEWAYRATGQRSAPRRAVLTIFEQAGFQAQWEKTAFEGARAGVIIAAPAPTEGAD